MTSSPLPLRCPFHKKSVAYKDVTWTKQQLVKHLEFNHTKTELAELIAEEARTKK